MKKIIFLILSLAFMCACKQKENVNEKVCIEKIPPPPPPEKYEIDINLQMVGVYGSEKIDFDARLISDNLISNGSEYIQTYKLIGRNKFESDTFYISCPNRYNCKWGKFKLSIDRKNMCYYVGFETNKDFLKIYRLRLGSAELNSGRIYLDYVDKKKDL